MTLQIIFTSGSGHTEFVVEQVLSCLREKLPALQITVKRAEAATANDVLAGDVLLLASGSWNTGGEEGQLQPYMHQFLTKTAAATDLAGRTVALIGLGDQRYTFVCRAADKLEEFVDGHGGQRPGATLRIINEPYDQTEKIAQWVKDVLIPVCLKF